jgi:tRNA threonylcarbamoyl adenosine modification protein YeaZ
MKPSHETQNSVYLSIDTSYQRGVVVLFDESQIYFSHVSEQKLTHSTALPEVIQKALDALKPSMVLAGLGVGLGPGSFVGIRIALATTLGFAFGRGLPIMGFCSHQAIAYSWPDLPGGHIFMKAAGLLGYFSTFSHGGTLELSDIAVIAKDDMAAADQMPILSDFGDSPLTVPCLGPEPEGVRQAFLAKLRLGGLVDESLSIKPNYVKDPSVTPPKPFAPA